MHQYGELWFWLLAWILFFVAVVVLVKVLMNADRKKKIDRESRLEVLKEQYKNGEITEEQYEQGKKELGW